MSTQAAPDLQALQPLTGNAPEPSADGVTLPPLSETSIEQIDGHLYGDKPLKFDGSADTKKEEPPATPTPEPPQPPATPPPADGEPDKILPNRIPTAQFTEDEQRAIAMLRDMRATDPAATLKDAYALIEARNATPTPPPTPPPAPEPSVLETLTAEKAALDAEMQAAEDEGLRITQAQVTRASELAAKLAVEQEREETRKFIAQQNETDAKRKLVSDIEASKLEVLQDYPSAADPESPLGKEVAAVIAEMKNDPAQREVLNTKLAPSVVTNTAADRVARKMAAEQNISFAAARSTLLSTGTPGQPARPPTASGGWAIPPAPPLNPMDSLGSPDSFDPSTADKALYGEGRPAFYIGR